ncbi:MAG TPA: DUF364 domain-containing protein [Syntrophomonadaceae bacterium]|nr:DUF364 domain-containing protein [Syntrophomonadaceae bacterium]
MMQAKGNQCIGKCGDMEEMYDKLIASVSESLLVLDCMVGLHWTLIRSEKGTGMAKTLTGGEQGAGLDNVTGMPLKELAAYVKSGNHLEVSLGMAAINSALNHLNHVEEISDPDSPNAFDHFVSNFAGKKVATVGYFPMLEPLGEICQLSIIEREPKGDNYPEVASEYILPDQDFVFITGTTFLYKTALKFIELSKNAKIILVGASVPLSPILFCYGVDTLAGVVVIDEKKVWQMVRAGGKKKGLADSTQTVFIQR